MAAGDEFAIEMKILECGANHPELLQQPELAMFLGSLLEIDRETGGMFPFTSRHLARRIFQDLPIEEGEATVHDHLNVLAQLGLARAKTGPDSKVNDAGDWLPAWELLLPGDQP